MFDLKRMPEIQEAPDRFRLLEQIPYSTDDQTPIQVHAAVGDEIKLLLIDFETTGFTAGVHEVIEAGLVQIAYSPSARKITAILEITSQLEQPNNPIPPLITNITGISNDDVAGQTIDDAHIARLMIDSELTIAHNAQFDRSFSDKRFKGLAGRIVWACSVKDINWYELGYESAKLEYLLLKNGFFYEGHRAAIDCLAMVSLFEAVPNALPELLQAAKQVNIKILAKGVAYDDREVVKSRGYRWNAKERHWWHVVPEAEYDTEKEFLDDLCGGGRHRNEFVIIQPTERHITN